MMTKRVQSAVPVKRRTNLCGVVKAGLVSPAEKFVSGRLPAQGAHAHPIEHCGNALSVANAVGRYGAQKFGDSGILGGRRRVGTAGTQAKLQATVLATTQAGHFLNKKINGVNTAVLRSRSWYFLARA